jgi:hypothetical protein
MNTSTPKQWYEENNRTYRVGRRFNGSNKHVEMIEWAPDSVWIEHEGANQGDYVLTDR